MEKNFVKARTQQIKQSIDFNVQWEISDLQKLCGHTPTLRLDCSEDGFLESAELRLREYRRGSLKETVLLTVSCMLKGGRRTRLYMEISCSTGFLDEDGGNSGNTTRFEELEHDSEGFYTNVLVPDSQKLLETADSQGSCTLKLKMKLYITPLETEVLSSCRYLHEIDGTVTVNELANDFEKLWKETKDFDVTFVFPKEDGETLKVHKLLLEARCSNFLSIVKSGTTVMEVSDISLKCMKVVVEFLYTDRIKATDLRVHLKELVYAANKFGIEGLRRAAEDFLSRTAENENDTLYMEGCHEQKVDSIF